MSHEKQLIQWLEDQHDNLISEILNMTEYDQYALMNKLDTTIWWFIRCNYDENYRLPYIGIS
jgi:hypothetical protein